jgi:thiosulfate/3-mercaptopyruvate sulfurtransferase
MPTACLFRDDSYLKQCRARVVAVSDAGVTLDRTVFYANSGGQPGDAGDLVKGDGSRLAVTNVIYTDPGKTEIAHVLPAGHALTPGDEVTAAIEWDRRYARMRMHTALHLLSAALPYAVTGGSVGDKEGRLDFDIPDAGTDKDAVTQKLRDMIAADAAVTSRWISDEELADNPGLIKTMSVKPPIGTGRVRLIEIAGSTSSLAAARMCEAPAKSVLCASRRSRKRANRTAACGSPLPDEKMKRCARRTRSVTRRTSEPGVIGMVNEQPASRWLKTTEWLAGKLDDPSVIAVDGSYHLGTANRDARQEYLDGHIPGAVFFDINAIADTSTDLPHMLPGPDQFGEAAGALGISATSTIVVYDANGLYSAPRVWWTFRIFGAKNVFVLDGGLPKWKAENRPLEQGEAKRKPAKFAATMDTGAVAMVSDVQMALNDRSAQVVDARSSGRFHGREAEPRKGLRAGHMPGARNVPYTEIVENGRLVAPERIAEAFAKAGVDTDRPIITTCGSGVTAAILTFGLEALGKDKGRVYDGSWSEWGGRPDLAVAKD